MIDITIVYDEGRFGLIGYKLIIKPLSLTRTRENKDKRNKEE